jgi:hypothetical protein
MNTSLSKKLVDVSKQLNLTWHFTMHLKRTCQEMSIQEISIYNTNTIKLTNEYDQYLDIATGDIDGPNGKGWTNVRSFVFS